MSASAARGLLANPSSASSAMACSSTALPSRACPLVARPPRFAPAQCARQTSTSNRPIQPARAVNINRTEGGNGEVVGGGAGTRLSPEDLDAYARKKAGKPVGTTARLSDALNSVSIVVVGPSTDLNQAVAQALGKRIGWFAVATRRVMFGLHRAETVEELGARLAAEQQEQAASASSSKDEADLVGAAEADVLRGLSTQFRCCVATLGGQASAVELAARRSGGSGGGGGGGDNSNSDPQDALRRQLAGTLVLWVEEVDRRAAGNSSGKRSGGTKQPAGVQRATAEQRPYAALAEVRVALEVGGGFGGAGVAATMQMTADQKADKAVPQIITTLAKVLEQDEDMPGRKRAYVEEVLIGRERLAQAAEARAEGLERAQAAMEKARAEASSGGGGGGDHPLDR
jgi:hypothetical protein